MQGQKSRPQIQTLKRKDLQREEIDVYLKCVLRAITSRLFQIQKCPM